MNVKQLTADMQAWRRKQANAEEAANAAGLPGSENSKSVSVPAPLPGAAENAPVPAAGQPTGTSTASSEVTPATPGEQTVTVGATPEVPVAKEPLVKSELDKKASQADALAQQLTSRILAHHEELQKSAAAPKAPAATTPAATPAAAPAPAKTASNAINMELTGEVLSKIGAVMCATEDGLRIVREKLGEYFGAAEAANAAAWVGYLQQQEEALTKQAADEAEFLAGQQLGEQVHALAEHPLFKQGQEMGAEALGIDPEMLAGVEGELPPDAAMTEGAEDEASPDDVIGALELLVQGGVITPEQAAEFLAQASEAGDAPATPDATPPAAEPPPAAAADAPPAAAEPKPEEGEKAASAKKLSREDLAGYFARVR